MPSNSYSFSTPIPLNQTVYGGSGGLGSVPSPPGIASTTQPGTTEAAIQAGQIAYSQLPGYNTDVSNVGGNISSEIAGQLPEDVANQIATAAAERGVATGSPGSPNSTASYLDSLGLNSLALTQTGQTNLQSMLQSLPGGAISQNPSFYTTPEQQYQAGLENAILRAAPDPSAVAAAQLAAARSGYAAGAGGTTPVSSFPGLNLGVGTSESDAFMASGGPGTVVLGATPGASTTTTNGVTPITSPYAGLPQNNMVGGGADTPDAGVEQDPVSAILQAYGPTVTGEETPGGEEEVAAGYGYDPFSSYGGGDFGGD